MPKVKNHAKTRQRHKASENERYEDFVIEQFKNDHDFLRLCLKKSFIDYVATDDKSYFLNILQKAVKAYGVSKIADKSGIARQHIYQICSKDSNPSLENFRLILKALGLKISLK